LGINPLTETSNFAHAFGGMVLPTRGAIPYTSNLSGDAVCAASNDDSTEAITTDIDGSVWFGKIGNTSGQLGSVGVVNKVGKLLIPDGLTIMNASDTANGSATTVELPDPGAGLFTGDVYGQIVPSHGIRRLRAAADSAGPLIATVSSKPNGKSPFLLVTVNPTAAAAQLLNPTHGPLQLTATVSFRPAGSKTTITRTATQTVPAAS
jgi:hypothetical protein